MLSVRHPVYLVRHGQSEWNLRRLTQGQTSHPPLTPLGSAQAEMAADLIASDLATSQHRVSRLLTSDLTRAVQTAEVIGARLGLTPEPQPQLREQHLGRLEGMSYEETWAVAEHLDWIDPEAPIEGGESVMTVRRRMSHVVNGLDPDKVHVLVSHGDSIRMLLAELQGHPPHQVAWLDVPNGAVVKYDHEVTWLGSAGRH